MPRSIGARSTESHRSCAGVVRDETHASAARSAVAMASSPENDGLDLPRCRHMYREKRPK
eukprot:3519756-Prymnesium_polylepis.1